MRARSGAAHGSARAAQRPCQFTNIGFEPPMPRRTGWMRRMSASWLARVFADADRPGPGRLLPRGWSGWLAHPRTTLAAPTGRLSKTPTSQGPRAILAVGVDGRGNGEESSGPPKYDSRHPWLVHGAFVIFARAIQGIFETGAQESWRARPTPARADDRRISVCLHALEQHGIVAFVVDLAVREPG